MGGGQRRERKREDMQDCVREKRVAALPGVFALDAPIALPFREDFHTPPSSKPSRTKSAGRDSGLVSLYPV